MRVITDDVKFRQNVEASFSMITNKNKRKNIEVGIYNFSIKEAGNKNLIKKWNNKLFVEIYINRWRSLYINFNNNKKLINKINRGKITTDAIANYTHQELNPDLWKQLIADKIERDKNKYDKRINLSSEFYCHKCKNNNCSYYQLQTRSADEPTTIFVIKLTSWNFKKSQIVWKLRSLLQTMLLRLTKSNFIGLEIFLHPIASLITQRLEELAVL